MGLKDIIRCKETIKENELREKQLKLPVRDVKRYTKLSNAICDTAKTLLTYF